MIRRLVAAVLGLSLVFVPVAASADEGLADAMTQASTHDFHGMGAVLSTWGADSAGAMYQIESMDGMWSARGPVGQVYAGKGEEAITTPEGWRAIELPSWSEWWMNDRYTMTEPAPTERLGRPAMAMSVLENGVERMRIVVDEETGVPLLTEVLDGAGRVFRLSVMIEFGAVMSDVTPMGPDPMPEMEPMAPADRPERLPAEIAGYRAADAYEAPGGATQVFYSDGLFSFSVFESKRAPVPDFDGATVWEVDGGKYRRIVTPSVVWVQWDAPDHTYVLVGDLPPDHLEQVLAGMPQPGDRGLLVRIWRRLFG